MAKKKSGHAKTKNMRVAEADLIDLKLLRKVLKQPDLGDTIHRLVEMFKLKQIGHYSSPLKEQDVIERSVYEDLENTNKVLKKTIDLLCEKQGIKFAQAIELVKCQT